MKKTLIVYIVFLFVQLQLFSCSKQKLTGTEVVNEKTITVYLADGTTPASNSTIRFYSVDDTSKNYKFETKTDKFGQYSLAGVNELNGMYNVWDQLNDTLLAFQDSVLITTNGNTIKNDTLNSPGSFIAYVTLQPNDDPRTVTVQVLGTNKFANVDSSAQFILSGMASGEYALRIASTLPNYTPIYPTIKIRSGITNTIKDTFKIIYTGIPVVTGLKISYDSLQGIVMLSWSKPTYPYLQDYLIYRASFDSIQWPPIPLTNRIDTTCADSIYKKSISNGPFSFFDTTSYHFKYRICVRNNSNQTGLSFKSVDIQTVPPTKLKTVNTISLMHLKKGLNTDTISINDSIQIISTFSTVFRPYNKISWSTGVVDSIKKVKILDSTAKAGIDTFFGIWSIPGKYKVYTLLEDRKGTRWIDSTSIHVIEHKPFVDAGRDTTASIGQAIKLRTSSFDKYGEIIKFERSIVESGQPATFSVVSGVDTTIVINSSKDLKMYIRVTNDDGLTAVDSISIRIYPTPTIVSIDSIFGYTAYIRWSASTNSDFRSYHIIGALKSTFDSAIVIDTILSQRSDTTKIISNLPDNSICYFRVDVTDSSGVTSKSTVVHDTTKQVWFNKTPMPTKRCRLVTCVVNGKIYAIGGLNFSQRGTLNTVEEFNPSANSWIQKTSMPTARHSAFGCVYADKIYVLGGETGSNASQVLEVYDPQTDLWTAKTSCPVRISAYADNSALIANTIYVITNTTCYEYNILTDTWTTKDAGFKALEYATSTAVNNKMYIFGGEAFGTPLQKVIEYDPVQKISTAKTSMPSKRLGFTSVLKDTVIYSIGGDNAGATVYNIVEIYNPQSDKWSYKPPMHIPRRYAASCVVNGKIYVIGGNNFDINQNFLNSVEEYIDSEK